MSKELLLKAKKRKKRKNCRNGECKAKNQVLRKPRKNCGNGECETKKRIIWFIILTSRYQSNVKQLSKTVLKKPSS